MKESGLRLKKETAKVKAGENNCKKTLVTNDHLSLQC